MNEGGPDSRKVIPLRNYQNWKGRIDRLPTDSELAALDEWTKTITSIQTVQADFDKKYSNSFTPRVGVAELVESTPEQVDEFYSAARARFRDYSADQISALLLSYRKDEFVPTPIDLLALVDAYKFHRDKLEK